MGLAIQTGSSRTFAISRQVWQVRTMDALVMQEGGAQIDGERGKTCLHELSERWEGPSEARSPDCQSLPTGAILGGK